MNTPLPIFPAPKEIVDLPGEYRFDGELTVNISKGVFSPETAELVCEMFSQHCQTGCVLTLREDEALPAFSARAGSVGFPDQPTQADAYSIRIEENGFALTGGSMRGLLYAFFTLMQCPYPTSLEEGREHFYMECGEIRDEPAIPRRAIHLCVFPQYNALMLEKAVREAAYLKMNYVIFEFWGTFPFKVLPELRWKDSAFTEEQIKSLMRLARSLGMEIIPMFNHWGHAPMSRGRVGKHVVLDQNPRHALLYEPDGWTWCLSNPDTMALLRGVREELMEMCGPGSYFHLGCDEASPFGSCPKCRKVNFIDFVPKYINGIADELEKAGRRAIVWADQYLDSTFWKPPIYGTSTPDYPTHEMLKNIDRKIILSDWQYRLTSPELPSSEYFMKQGFDVWPAAFDDTREDFEVLPPAADRIGAYGCLATTWNHLPSLMQRMPDICASAWCGQRYQRHPEQGILAFTLLRRVMPVAGDYKKAGYMPDEVDPDGYRTII